MSAFEDATDSIQIQTMMILARPAPNTPPARYQGRGRRRFNGAVKTHNKKPQLPLNGALRDSVRTRGGGLRKAAGAQGRLVATPAYLVTEVLEEVPVSEDWGGGGESCLEDLAAERRRREVQEGVLGGGGTGGGRGGLFRRILKSRTIYT